MNISDKVKEIQRLKKAVNEPFRQVNLKRLKTELLEVLQPGVNMIDEFVVYKTDTFKPYLQIYTLKSWEISQQKFNA